MTRRDPTVRQIQAEIDAEPLSRKAIEDREGLIDKLRGVSLAEQQRRNRLKLQRRRARLKAETARTKARAA